MRNKRYNFDKSLKITDIYNNPANPMADDYFEGWLCRSEGGHYYLAGHGGSETYFSSINHRGEKDWGARTVPLEPFEAREIMLIHGIDPAKYGL